MGDAGEDGGIGNLVAVEVQNRKHRAIGDGVEKFVGVPGGGQRARLRLAVAHHTGGNQVRVIEHGAKGMGQRIAQLTALVDRARGIRGHMGLDAAGEGELLEQTLQALLVLTDIGVDLTIGAVEVIHRDHTVAAVAGAREIDHIQVILVDNPVEMGVHKGLTGDCAPVADDFSFDVFGL